MELGTELLLKEESFGYKRGDILLYLRHCTDSGSSCVEAVVVDDHFRLLMKEWKVYTLKQAYETFISDNIIPMDLDQFCIRFNTIKPRVDQVVIKSDLFQEQKRLKIRLNEINELISLTEL